MEAGKAVLVEKPFALNLTQAERMVDAARRRSVFCMEAMWMRFIPAVMEAKRRIDDGAIGPVRLIQGNFAFSAPAGSNSRLFDIEMGGGV
jgi:predicted dehydrogenase